LQFATTNLKSYLNRDVLTVPLLYQKTRCHAIAGKTARCRCKFRYDISNFTTASCGFSDTAETFLYTSVQWPF